ncbi:MAG: energy-coupling factor ABC transporter permease [Oligoflexia bacterium]|nr:energy-coupling factor ABC transporter permease [Oligoflexia bacterium]
MHIAEGVLPIRHAAAWGLVSSPFMFRSAQKIRRLVKTADPKTRAFLGMGFAFTFAATVFPIPVPIAGVSSHMCFTPLLSLILGPTVVVFPTMIILLIQAIFFAHGGLTTLGANVFTLGIVAPYGAWALAKGFRSLRVPSVITVGLVGFLADIAVYLTDAGILGFAFQGEKSFSYWFKWIALGFAPGQIPLAILEGVLSAYLVKALFARRPEIIPDWIKPAQHHLAQLGAAAVLTCALGFLFATPLLVNAAEPAPTSRYQGLDESVIEQAAHSAGKPPWRSILPVDQGDLGLFVWGTGGFLCGLTVGLNWMKLGSSSSSEVSKS